MSWKANTLDHVTNVMRFVAYGCLVIDGILLSVFSVWFVAKSLWQLHGWLNCVLFN